MDSLIQFLSQYGGEMLLKTWEHLYISFIAVGLGILIAVPVGVLLTRTPKIADIVMGLLGIVQTVPSFAILAFFIPLLGVGKVPAIAALFFYAVLPILRNTYTGVKGVNKSLIESGRGMGMTVWEQIRLVELPLAVPVIMAGIRLTTVYLIGWATLAAYIGAGGLGDYIFSGMTLYQTEFILAGAIPVTLLALLADFLLGKIENWVTPNALKQIKGTA